MKAGGQISPDMILAPTLGDFLAWDDGTGTPEFRRWVAHQKRKTRQRTGSP